MFLRLLTFGVFLTALAPSAWAAPRLNAAGSPLDRELRQRALTSTGQSRVIVHLAPGLFAEAAIRKLGGTAGRRLAGGAALVARVPDRELVALARLPGVIGISLDRAVQGTMERTGATVGAPWVRDVLGLDGTGVGIAIIDSGVANWHDDLGSGRVARFVDFVNFGPAAYDDYGHGTHVAGIIAGNGHDSGGRRSGLAPGATLLVEKVLDGSGQGYISNVIAAIDYAIANKDALHLRVINLSVAAAVSESYTTDPLTLAAKRAVEAGLVVVSAAGNMGKSGDGQERFGAIAAPGNAPWVLTVGASSHNGTTDRSDDTVAGFSSRGPSAIDRQAKPDLVAPGVGIESLGEPGSTLFNTKPLMRLWGTVSTASEPYLSLSGTSMASPVVSGTVALMLQANPALTPNLVKAILQFTAESHDDLSPLTQGAGFLNTRGAVALSRSLAASVSVPGGPQAGAVSVDPAAWSGRVIWGNLRIGGGRIDPAANAWRTDVIWGSATAPDGSPVVLGAVDERDSGRAGPARVAWTASCAANALAACDNIVWGTECGSANCDPQTRTGARRAVWAAACAGDDCGLDSAPQPGPAEGTTTASASSLRFAAGAADTTDDTVWSAPAIRRHSRMPVIGAALR